MDRISKLTAFLEQQPQDSFLRHALALEYVKAGNDEEAVKLFSAILGNDPGYIGSYYHLGKLLERIGEADKAITVYESGMAAAKQAGNQHSYNELQGAYEDLVY